MSINALEIKADITLNYLIKINIKEGYTKL